ncbi:MAG: indolepyruvate ferredoxin oxidoreductase, subunit beta (iorB) [Chloroflexi bacterium]|nr:indolepyruvate ferredoxin oxidoreductase, subunit beta (iorB) [Chloroflexota bacterium]
MATRIKEINIIIAGTGGQGVVLISEILGHAAVRDGLRVRGSEVLGMAQRGGPVFSNIRLGTEVEAPMNAEGTCDILAALEPSETLRYIQYLNKTSIVVFNTRKVIPATVTLGKSGYPALDQIEAKLAKVTANLIGLDALDLAEKAGSRQSVNVVMLGTIFGSGRVPLKIETAKAIIRERFPGKVADINIRAFRLGLEAARKASTSSVSGGSSI